MKGVGTDQDALNLARAGPRPTPDFSTGRLNMSGRWGVHYSLLI
jgi:hypothetical protein